MFSVTKIADAKSAAKGAFSNGGSYSSKDYDVRKIILPNSITYIGRYAFCYCKNLKYIEIPEGVTSLGYSLFDFSGVTTVIIPKSLQSLGGCGASGSTLNYGGFPVNEVYYRGSKKDWDNLPDASGDYKGLKSVKVYFMSPSIYERGDKFTVDDLQYEVTADNEVKVYKCNTSVVSVNIPENILYENYNFKVTDIVGYAFNGCSSLTSISVLENNENYSSIDGVLFNKDKTELIRCPEGKNIKYVIPDSVTKICNYAFQNCSSLTSIKIPNSVTKIGEYTFKDCSSLTSIEISDSVTEIGWRAFDGCTSLASIEIPSSVKKIGLWMFSDCTNLESITIKNPKCDIYDASSAIIETATIYGYENSTAQAYAEKYNRKFVSLGVAPEFMISDIVKLQKWLVKSGSLDNEDFAKYDLYNDGTLNVFDLVLMKRRILNT